MSAYEVTVPGWPTPKGFANGRVGKGRVLHVAGQIGCTPDGKFSDPNFPGQFAIALDNVIAVVRAAGASVEDIAEMTVYVMDMDAYRNARREIGAIWRGRLGTHYPAMALVAVKELFEREAVVEIQAIAYLGDAP